MRYIRYLFYFVVFTVSLLSSREASLAIFHPKIQIDPIASNPKIQEITKPSLSEQVNLLILHTSAFEDQPLISAWWVALAPRSPITIVNLYPTAQENEPSTRLLHEKFNLKRNPFHQWEINSEFMKLLRIRNIPWDGYIVMDHDSLAVLVDYLGGVNFNNESFDGAKVISNFQQPDQALGADFDFQNKLWEAICQKSIFASSPESFELVRPELQQHTILSAKFPLTLEDFRILNTSTQQIMCKVSTLHDEQTYMLPYRTNQPSQEK